MIENIDSVIFSLVSAGGEKIDWVQPGPNGSMDRSLSFGSWSIIEGTDFGGFEHLSETITKRLCRLDICLTDGAHLQAIFDPETRRIEGLEIYETDSGHPLMTLWFWPGLEVAKKMTPAIDALWLKAIDDGWLEGVI